MRRSIVRHLLALAVLTLPAAACNEDTPSTPTNPSDPVTVTETFSGSLTPNGALTFPFAVGSAGTVTVTLTTIQLAQDVTIGVSLGNWNDTAGSCQIVVDNSSAVQGVIVAGQIGLPANLCARVYDSKGLLTAATPFTITVAHPE
jgi:hypothetical protein